MPCGYLIKENSKDAEKIYYDFDDIETGNKLYREQFHPPKPRGWREILREQWREILRDEILRLVIIIVISVFIWFGMVILIGELLSWSDPEFRRGGGIIVVMYCFPFLWMVPYLVSLYI